MKPSLTVTAAGLGATLQDMGRGGFQALGVPPSGALDPVQLRLANWLVGNDGGEGAIEMRLSGPAFEVASGAVRVALSGEDARLRLGGTDDERVPAYRSVTLMVGQRFQVELRGGAVCYLAVEGGFDVAPVLGSVSTLGVAQLGGFSGCPLAVGDMLPLQRDPMAGGERQLRAPELAAPDRLRVILGPQDDYFAPTTIEQFLNQSFTASPLSNRMGLRLDGVPLRHARGFDIVSDGNAPGAIQVPGSGQPIILLADRGTTGGYPKIATVITADLPLLGRIAPGQTIGFEAVTQEQAVAALRTQNAWLANLKAAIQPYRDLSESLARALVEENIISGVTDARHPPSHDDPNKR